MCSERDFDCSGDNKRSLIEEKFDSFRFIESYSDDMNKEVTRVVYGPLARISSRFWVLNISFDIRVKDRSRPKLHLIFLLMRTEKERLGY